MNRIILSFLGSLGPAILFNTEKENLIWAGLSGTLGMLISDQVLIRYPNTDLLSVFLGTAAVAVYSELMARIRKTPATTFSIPGIFPLVPGVDAYRTIQLIAEQDYPVATAYAVSTVTKACLIAFGIMTVSAIFRKIRTKKYKLTP